MVRRNLGWMIRKTGNPNLAFARFRPHRILNFVFVAALLAMGGRISYNPHRFACKRVKQFDL